MTDTKQPLTVVFAPGAFDTFEGTQEELDALMAEIQETFANMTPEELAERSKPVDLTELLDGATEDEINHVLSAISEENKRNLH